MMMHRLRGRGESPPDIPVRTSIPEKNIWFNVTGFTQNWHSIPAPRLVFIGSTKDLWQGPGSPKTVQQMTFKDGWTGNSQSE